MGGKAYFNNLVDFSASLLPQPSNSDLLFWGPSSFHSPRWTLRKELDFTGVDLKRSGDLKEALNVLEDVTE